MTPLTQELNRHITKPLGLYHDDVALTSILRRRLTKKEYKVLMACVLKTPTREELQNKLSLDDKRYDAIWNTITKKLNNDTIKRELFFG
jgi:hypothetical protein